MTVSAQVSGKAPTGRLRWWALCFSIILFVVSLNYDAFCDSSNCVSGWRAFVLGPLALITNPSLSSYPWLANIFLLLAWLSVAVGIRGLAFAMGAPAFALAGLFLFARTYIGNEGGVPNPITHVGDGYGLWWTCIAVCNVAAYLCPKTTVALYAVEGDASHP